MIPERGIVAGPVSVEPHPPPARPGKPDGVRVEASVGEVGENDRVVVRPASVPATVRDQLVRVVDVVDLKALAPQPASCVPPVATQPDQIAVQDQYSRVALGAGPIDRETRIEPM